MNGEKPNICGKHYGAPFRYMTGCRCDRCIKAWARAEVFHSNPSDPRHGTSNGYTNLGCRCEACTEAWAAAHLASMHADPERLATHAMREALRRRGRQTNA